MNEKVAPPEEAAVLVLELRSTRDDVVVIDEDGVWIGGTDEGD